ncbi:peptide/nickel transport system permease protein [Branchiibius hedensis]|uniref:Peptide/nickel transport system permease protein n=1 Tax=Branchiibius hedensis TaxID=672460 RepID=A0A2Y8ZQD5_9MICO|nr:ABC transporter permease [Branchiibius hedensis]PWJ24691.1 peptide/nickel transport system permease protein [Branchiibius hedensis]SSA33508.1 peptide/nickel transport system permease protein [Branchiibius hedensis]
MTVSANPSPAQGSAGNESPDDVARRAVRRRPRVPRTLRQPLTIVGAAIVLFWLVVVIFGPWLEPFDPLAPSADVLQAPSAEHWMGTDALGRDVLSRLIAGARVTLPLSVLLVLLSMVLGGTLGAIAGYFGKVVDEVIMRIADLVFAFPTIILAMVVTAALGPGLRNAVLAVLVVSWPMYARITRSMVLGAKNNEYVVASRLLGTSSLRSLTRDILPNIVAPIGVLATMDFGTAVLLLSGLSFLGLGSVPPTPEWGAMVSDGVQNFQQWWLATFPGLAIFSIVIAFNFLGDALRDALDPRTRRNVGGRAV